MMGRKAQDSLWRRYPYPPCFYKRVRKRMKINWLLFALALKSSRVARKSMKTGWLGDCAEI